MHVWVQLILSGVHSRTQPSSQGLSTSLSVRVSPVSLEEEERLNERSRAEHYSKFPPNQKDAAR